jgi:hypothetical protein
MSKILKPVEASLDKMLSSPYVMAPLKILLILYASRIAPQLPEQADYIFNNVFGKILLITLSVYLAEKDLQLSILIASILIIGSNLISGRALLESFAPLKGDLGLPDNWKPKHSPKTLIEPKTHVYPGCLDITKQDLLKLFSGDEISLQNHILHSYKQVILAFQKREQDAEKVLEISSRFVGLPYNLTVNDETAPYIATLLMYNGIKVSDKCIVPQQ